LRNIGTIKPRKEHDMTPTKGLQHAVTARLKRDPPLREALIEQAVERLLDDDIDTAKAILRDYINAPET